MDNVPQSEKEGEIMFQETSFSMTQELVIHFPGFPGCMDTLLSKQCTV